MILFVVTLLLLQQGYKSGGPVITVQLGEPATLTCNLPDEWLGLNSLHWYKQDVGDSLKVITMIRKNTSPKFGPGFSASRVKTAYHEKTTNLTILKTTEEDEGMYHCAVIDWTQNTWSGTYLSVRGNSDRTLNYSVVHRSSVRSPVRLGDSATLECSVLSNSDTICSGDLKVFWFRYRSHQTYPEIIYTDDCEKKNNRCVYNLSKTITSSDAGTYYCAVATCGEILFGNHLNLQIEPPADSYFITLMTVIVVLIISVVLHICFIYYWTGKAARKQIRGKEDNRSKTRHRSLRKQGSDINEVEEDLNYAALYLSGGQTTRGQKKKRELEETVYSQINI